jgi:Tol biopolymer transport system component
MLEANTASKCTYLKWLKKTIWKLLIATSLLFACNPDGSNKGVTFVTGPGNPPAESIVWSRTNANAVLIMSSDPNHHNNQLSILNTKTLEKVVLKSNDTGKLFGLDWSPDGKYILFGSTSGFVGDQGNTLIMNTNGGDEQILMEWVPDAVWSPDGKTIAYFSYGQPTSTDSQEIALHVMDLSNKEDTVIAHFESQNTLGLSWSPNGERLVFALGSLKSSNLFVFDINTQETIQITEDGLADSPVWSPQGEIIAYHKFSKDGLESSLALVHSDGNCEVKIPDLNDVGSPTWLPDGKALGFIALDGIYTLDLEKVFIGDLYQEECPKIR